MIRVRSRAFAVTLLLPICLSACEKSQAGSTQPSPPSMLARKAAQHRQTSQVASQPLQSEADRIALDMAQSACRARDHWTFFNIFANSRAVRLKYSASTVRSAVLDDSGKNISERKFTPEEYRNFPIKMEDYYYRPAKPARAGDTGEYLDLQFNQSQSNVISVEWSRIHYDGRSEGGDDLGSPIDANGRVIPPGDHQVAEGQLLFAPTADCWEFIEDVRWKRGR